MDIFLVCILVAFGIALMVLELFFIPGIGFAGFASVASMGAAVALAYIRISPMAGNLTLVAVVILLAVSIVIFARGRSLDKMALKTDITDKVDLTSGLDLHPGDQGITSSRLAPMGKVMVRDHELEAKSLGSFIDQQTPVEIVRIEGNILVVKPLD